MFYEKVGDTVLNKTKYSQMHQQALKTFSIITSIFKGCLLQSSVSQLLNTFSHRSFQEFLQLFQIFSKYTKVFYCSDLLKEDTLSMASAVIVTVQSGKDRVDI